MKRLLMAFLVVGGLTLTLPHGGLRAAGPSGYVVCLWSEAGGVPIPYRFTSAAELAWLVRWCASGHGRPMVVPDTKG